MSISSLRPPIRTGTVRHFSVYCRKKYTGIVIGKDERKMGLHGSRTVQLSFENMEVPVENLLGEEGEGFKIAMANLGCRPDWHCCTSARNCRSCLEAATDYAKERVQFGKPIAAQQGIGFKLADMATTCGSC